MPQYAWLIATDHLDAGDPDDGLHSDAGTTGPSTAPDDLLARLEDGEGLPFQLLDDDGELYYSGRILVRGEDGAAYPDLGEEYFGPLEDWGTPNAGATEIQYLDPAGSWQGL